MKYSILKWFILIFAFAPFAASGQAANTPDWESANGVPCGTANSFAEHNNNSYVGTYGGGVFAKMSSDLGWRAINSGLDNRFVNSIAISPNGVMLAATRDGLYKTTVNNETWTKCNVGKEIETFDFVHSTSFGVLYAAGGSYLFRSSDEGNSWTIAAVLLNTLVNQIAEFTEEKLLMSTMTGMYYSMNSGVSWSALPQVSQSSRGVVVDENKKIYLVVNYKLVQATFDGFEAFDWTYCSQMEQYNVTGITLTNDSKLLVGTSHDGVLLLSDTNNISKVGLNNVSVTALPAYRSANKYVGYNTGIYKFDASYVPSPLSGLPNLDVGKVLVAPNADIYAILPQNRVSYSTDKGQTWSPAGENQAGSMLDACIVAQDGNLVAGTEWALIRSTNKGSSWISTYPTDEFLGIKSIIKRGTGELVAVGYESVYTSTDNGSSWSLGFSMAGVGFVPSSVVESSTGVLYVLLDNRVARSVGDIANWEDISIPDGLGEIYKLEVIDGKPVIVCSNIAYSYDEATLGWTPLFPAIGNESWINSLIKMDEHYFASMHNGGMYLFSIQYNQWYRIDSPELSIQTNSAALANGYEMYVGTSGFGLLKAKFLFMPAEDTPRDNSITVGPCPAKDYLRIELPAGTSAAPEIRIVNISGERMPVRVDFDAAGSVATVDCSGLATGIYCCFVGNGASASMEKIIIAR